MIKVLAWDTPLAGLGQYSCEAANPLHRVRFPGPVNPPFRSLSRVETETGFHKNHSSGASPIHSMTALNSFRQLCAKRSSFKKSGLGVLCGEPAAHHVALASPSATLKLDRASRQLHALSLSSPVHPLSDASRHDATRDFSARRSEKALQGKGSPSQALANNNARN